MHMLKNQIVTRAMNPLPAKAPEEVCTMSMMAPADPTTTARQYTRPIHLWTVIWLTRSDLYS
jgi:hypothetical protein